MSIRDTIQQNQQYNKRPLYLAAILLSISLDMSLLLLKYTSVSFTTKSDNYIRNITASFGTKKIETFVNYIFYKLLFCQLLIHISSVLIVSMTTHVYAF